MGLWLEHRDETGRVIERERFVDGIVSLVEKDLTLKDAVERARPSAHMPVERREWTLRIDFGGE